MASCSTEANKTHQIRSLSLPSKLNPINQKIEKELKRLGTKEESSTSTSESIIIGVTGLAELYKCINQALSLPMTQQALSLRHHEKHVGEILKGSSGLLNVCRSMLEVVQQQGAISKVLFSCLSDERDVSQVVSNIANYISARKEVIRKAKDIHIIMSLDQLNAQFLVEENYHLSTVIKSLRCVSMINLSVYDSLSFFMSMPVSKPKRSLVSKLMNKELNKCDNGNEINKVDNMLHELCSSSSRTIDDEKLCLSLDKLKKLVSLMDDVESSLSNVITQLTETKACLVNIVSF